MNNGVSFGKVSNIARRMCGEPLTPCPALMEGTLPL